VSASRDHILAKAAPWATATALLVLAVVVLYFFTGAAATQESRAAPVSSTDITYGPRDAKLTVIEYSDFACPWCAQYARWLTRLRAKYGGQVRFVFRFSPLPDHRWARSAAETAYAAYLQGRFWQMHDLLFKKQPEWVVSEDPRPLFEAYARSLGLDVRRFRDDADAKSTLDFVRREADESKRAGVTSTPSFVVGGRSVFPRSLEQFDKVIREKL
jgi:protein-disulfide isomerase